MAKKIQVKSKSNLTRIRWRAECSHHNFKGEWRRSEKEAERDWDIHESEYSNDEYHDLAIVIESSTRTRYNPKE